MRIALNKFDFLAKIILSSISILICFNFNNFSHFLFRLPFFIFYVVSAFCVNCNISYEVKSGITWLGYINR